MAREEDKGSPLPCQGQGGGKPGLGALAGSPLSVLLFLAGVTGILAMELFDQKARPAACMVGGALVWTLLFLVGLGFPFIKVGLPCLPKHWGPVLGFTSVSSRALQEVSILHQEAGEVGTHLNQEGRVSQHHLS